MDDGFAPLGRAKVFLPRPWSRYLACQPEAEVFHLHEARVQKRRTSIPRILGPISSGESTRRVFGRERLLSSYIGDRERPCELAICRRCAAAQPLPRLRAFLDRMHSRSSSATSVEEEAPIFDRPSGRSSIEWSSALWRQRRVTAMPRLISEDSVGLAVSRPPLLDTLFHCANIARGHSETHRAHVFRLPPNSELRAVLA